MRNYWSKVLFCDFIKHFRKMTAEEIAEDVMASMDALEELDDSGKNFGAKMVKWSNERIAFNRETRGSKGGRPRKTQSTTATQESSKNFPDTPGGSASPAGCASGKRIPPQESTTAAGESAEKLDPPNIGGSAASAGRAPRSPRAGEVSDSPEVSESSDAANRCFASPAESAAGKRTPRTAEGSAARSLPPSTAELYDFAEAARLSEADAREWWELCTERGWKDRSGKPIRDWKKACERYCARRAINRMAKGET